MSALLRGWQRVFEGDSFDFDYYLGRAHYGDPGYCRISQVIGADTAYLKEMGLNGILSCQELRAFFPTALPNYILAARLWNPAMDIGVLKEEYALAAFGSGKGASKEYLEEISRSAPIDYWYRKCRGVDRAVEETAGKAADVAARFAERIEELETYTEETCVRLSWLYLKYHTAYTSLWMRTIEARAGGDSEKAAACWGELKQYLCDNERVLERAFDVFRFIDLGNMWMQP